MKTAMYAATGIMVATAALISTPGQAGLSQCQGTNTCIWENNDFGGIFAGRSAGEASVANVPSNINNRMDSWANKSSANVSCGWDGTNGTGDNQTWASVSNDNNVAPASSDEVSSWRTKYGC